MQKEIHLSQGRSRTLKEYYTFPLCGTWYNYYSKKKKENFKEFHVAKFLNWFKAQKLVFIIQIYIRYISQSLVGWAADTTAAFLCQFGQK